MIMKNKIFLIVLCMFIAFSSVVATADTENVIESDVEVLDAIVPPLPDLSVYIYKDPIPAVCDINTMITFYSVLTNAEYYSEFKYQWLRSHDEITWEEIPGATEETYTTPLVENTEVTYYKLRVYYR